MPLIGEDLRTRDTGRIDVWGVLHITDGPVAAALVSATTLAPAPIWDALRPSDGPPVAALAAASVAAPPDRVAIVPARIRRIVTVTATVLKIVDGDVEH